MSITVQEFGLLSYKTFNIGDYIQSLAASRFLPKVDYYIDREALDDFTPSRSERVKLIMNGWYCHRPDRWPPSPSIEPLLVSFHVSGNPGEGSGLRARDWFPKSPGILDYPRQHGPVGARDLSTLELFHSWEVPAYFSGCLTLTIERSAVPRQEGLIVLCDAPEEVAARVCLQFGPLVRRVKHRDATTDGIESRLARARTLLELYASAACVVTTRLHCACPCLAMNTPVLLLDTAADKYRFSGLIDLLHHCSVEDFLSGASGYDLARPPANPDSHMALRRNLIDRASAFTA